MVTISVRLGEKGDFHSKEIFSDDDLAGKTSTKALKSLVKLSTMIMIFFEKLDLPIVSRSFGPLQERMWTEKSNCFIIIDFSCTKT